MYASPRITHAGQPNGRFTSSTFTNQAKYLALIKVEVNVVNNNVAGDALQSKALDLQYDLIVHAWFSCSEFSLGTRRTSIHG